MQEYTGSGRLKTSNVYGNERIYSDVYNPVSRTFDTKYYNYDGRGSVTQNIVNGEVTKNYRYAPFGNITVGEPTSASYYGFNAEETSALTGVQYLRARYFDTSDGRFITADDYLGDIEEPQTLNRYIYTANNPVRYVDPSGHLFGWVKKAAKKVGSGFKKLGSAISTGAKKVASKISSGVRKAASSIKSSLNKAYTAVKNVAKRTYTAVKNTVKKVYNYTTSLARSVASTISKGFKTFTRNVKRGYNYVKNTASNYASNMVTGAKNLASGAKHLLILLKISIGKRLVM